MYDIHRPQATHLLVHIATSECTMIPLSKVWGSVLRPVECALKLQAQHRCVVCEHKWSKYPLMQENSMAVLGCQLRDSTLFVQKLPINISTLGVTDHHSVCC